MSEVKVSIIITGLKCVPSEITSILDVEPTSTWLMGDLIYNNASIKRKQNGWKLDSKIGKSNKISDHINSLFKEISDKLYNFKQLPSDCEIEIACCIYVKDDIPEISLEHKMVESISSIGAGIDIDIIDLSNDTV